MHSAYACSESRAHLPHLHSCLSSRYQFCSLVTHQSIPPRTALCASLPSRKCLHSHLHVLHCWTLSLKRGYGVQVLPPRQPAPQDWPPFVAPDTMPGSQAPAAALVQPFTPREAISPAAAEAEDAGVPSPSTNRQLASAGIILLFVSVVIALTVYAFVVAMRRKAAKDREEKNSKAATGGMLQGGVVGGPTKEDSHARQVAKLSRQLDLFKNDDLLLEQYELLGRDKMCRGSAHLYLPINSNIDTNLTSCAPYGCSSRSHDNDKAVLRQSPCAGLRRAHVYTRLSTCIRWHGSGPSGPRQERSRD